MVRESKSCLTDKSIYPRLGYHPKAGGFERDFMNEILNPSSDVLSYAKLDRRHKLKITYRDSTAILRNYEVDFIVKTKDKVFLVETKADKDITLPNVAVKARAAAWCDQASTLETPRNINQAKEWEYLILSETIFKNNRGLSFNGLIPFCKGLRDNILAQAESKLFV
jgi:type III restriction enzyme